MTEISLTQVIERSLTKAARSVVKCGGGRRFVVQVNEEKLVITAGHCLPPLPPSSSCLDWQGRFFKDFLGELGAEPTVAAVHRYSDRQADIAVLGPPYPWIDPLAHQAYNSSFVGKCRPIKIANSAPEQSASLLSLENRWFSCKTKHLPEGGLLVFDAAQPLVGGMSGSPIVDNNGRAIAIFVTSEVYEQKDSTLGGPNPRLYESLSGRLLQQLGVWRRRWKA